MKTLRYLILGGLSAAAVANAWAGQQSVPTAPAAATAEPQTTAAAPADVQAVRDRTKAFYAALIKGDRATARKMVAPESENDFEQIDLRTLVSATVDNVSISGDSAVASVTRNFGPPYSMPIVWKDQWKKVNGDWMLALPTGAATAVPDNPFGIKPPANAQPLTEEQARRQAEWQQKTVDPDQLYKAVQKLQLEDLEKRKAAMAAAAQGDQQSSPEQPAPKNKKKSSKKDPKDVKKDNSMSSTQP